MPNLGIYIPDHLNNRLQRLRAQGIELNASSVASQALEAAVEAEEKALTGDRVTRLLARLRAAKTAREVAEAEGESAGRQWAEDVAAMSELKTVKRLLDKMAEESLEVYAVHTGVGVSLQFIQWEPSEDSPLPLDGFYSLPDSVSKDFFERAKRDQYTAVKTGAFMRGAVDVLHVVEQAIAREEAERKRAAFRQTLIKAARKAQK